MGDISFEVEGFEPNVTIKGQEYTLVYPCPTSHSCSPYSGVFPAGFYLFELYGGSGGSYFGEARSRRSETDICCITDEVVSKYRGNTVCNLTNSLPGAGGYTSGILYLRKETKFFIHLGGHGSYTAFPDANTSNRFEDEYRPKGGYNGGGRGSGYFEGTSGGGGSSDLRAEVDDLFHRILVAGGGGGSDNYYPAPIDIIDDGTGGAGGGLCGQNFWVEGSYVNDQVACQESGFSFGQGESALYGASNNPNGYFYNKGGDEAGAGGGWFGGYASHHRSGGGGGGSSFVLTSKSSIPRGIIKIHDEFYNEIDQGLYAFSTNSQFAFLSSNMEQGIWSGNGFARIQILPSTNFHILVCSPNYSPNPILYPFFFISFVMHLK